MTKKKVIEIMLGIEKDDSIICCPLEMPPRMLIWLHDGIMSFVGIKNGGMSLHNAELALMKKYFGRGDRG